MMPALEPPVEVAAQPRLQPTEPIIMSAPRVSICMPHLNSGPFLHERMRTILQQTIPDWELIVIDSQSDDGSRQTLEKHAASDPRIRLFQGPRDGIYPNLNRALERCTGEYVYIAMSDDTMAGDCLEKMVAALDEHTGCDIAHCPIRVINEQGDHQTSSWATTSAFARSSGALIGRYHVRRAPFDGLLHLLGGTVYRSLTQLLIRRSLFERVGVFENTWGSVGDFHWGMRAALRADVIHVPDTWGGWRRHAGQATPHRITVSEAYRTQADSMIADALEKQLYALPPPVRTMLTPQILERTREMRRFLQEFTTFERSGQRLAFLARGIASGSWAARSYARWRINRRPGHAWGPDVIQRWLSEAGNKPVLSAVPPIRKRERLATQALPQPGRA